MAEQSKSGGSFSTRFLPGLAVGVVIGGLAGAFISPILTEGGATTQAPGSAGAKPGGPSAAPRDQRPGDAKPAPTDAKPEDKKAGAADATKPSETKPADTTPADAAKPAETKPAEPAPK
ncbi:MAG: hypothetical protein GC200_05690 [Tepidisphaera sp.]|nr:hypothetical protein [Tepidisphaera sp.]